MAPRRSTAAARRAAREREILTATRTLFDERGVRDAQLHDVARAVGINRALIYRHFSGKEELFALTLVDYLDELAPRLAAVAPGGGDDHAERLRTFTGVFVDYGIAHPAFVDCATALLRRPSAELAREVSPAALDRLGRAMAGALEHLVRLLAEGTEAGVFAVEDPDVAANVLYVQALGHLHLASLGAGARLRGGDERGGAPGPAGGLATAPLAGVAEWFRIDPATVRRTSVEAAVAVATGAGR